MIGEINFTGCPWLWRRRAISVAGSGVYLNARQNLSVFVAQVVIAARKVNRINRILALRVAVYLAETLGAGRRGARDVAGEVYVNSVRRRGRVAQRVVSVGAIHAPYEVVVINALRYGRVLPIGLSATPRATRAVGPVLVVPIYVAFRQRIEGLA